MCRQKIASFVFLAGIVLLAFASHVSAENPSGFKGVCTVNDSCTSAGQCSDYEIASDGNTSSMPAQTNVTITENAENSDSNHSNATSGRRLLQNVTSNTTDGDGTDTAATTMIATTTTPISCTCCETPITSAPDTAAATLAISTTPIPVLLQCWGQADSTMSTTGKIASSLWPIGATTTTCGAAQANFQSQ